MSLERGLNSAFPELFQSAANGARTGIDEPDVWPMGVHQWRRDVEIDSARQADADAYIESFNGKFRDECLNEHGSTTLAHARAITAAWCQEYNEKSLHSVLNYLSPGKFSGPLWLFLYDL
jgi:putative transposase